MAQKQPLENDLATRMNDAGAYKPGANPAPSGWGNPLEQIPRWIGNIGKSIARADSVQRAKSAERHAAQGSLKQGAGKSPSTISKK